MNNVLLTAPSCAPELQEEIDEYGEDNIGEDLTDEEVHELASLIVNTFGSKS